MAQNTSTSDSNMEKVRKKLNEIQDLGVNTSPHPDLKGPQEKLKELEALANNMSIPGSDMQKAQNKIKEIQAFLSAGEVKGVSQDGTVEVILTYSYQMLVPPLFDLSAMEGGVALFKKRLMEAWNDAVRQITITTQGQVMNLFEDMGVPREFMKELSKDDSGSEGFMGGDR